MIVNTYVCTSVNSGVYLTRVYIYNAEIFEVQFRCALNVFVYV